MKLLEMQGICKAFNGIPVLRDVWLSVEKGEVHALLGENGAGKSTLMNILTGSVPLDRGTITFDGKIVKHVTIRKSEEAGIAFVHQELNLFNDLTVYENIFLCKEYTNRFGRLKKKEMVTEATELFGRLDVEIDPMALVSDLKTSDKQLLEIAKALFFDAKLLILDEPTTSLNNDEVEHLFRIVDGLKKDGISFIFISHKMPEIFQYADSYTVLRDGEFVGSGRIDETTPEEITRKMVGNSYSANELYEPRHLGEPTLELVNFSGPGFENITLTARTGQIIGLTGLRGSGSSELLQCIFGVTQKTGGSLKVFGKDVSSDSIHCAMEAKIAMLPSNRKENSVVPDMSLLENMYLSEHTLSAWKFPIRRGKEEKKFEKFKQLLNIKAQDSRDLVTSLSGGSQQKVFLARWLNTDAQILLLDNPTQGIDVGAKAEIYKRILEMAKNGKTILVNTLEIPEIQKVADYCAIFYNGKIIKILDHQDIEEQTVMLYSTNSISSLEGN